MDIESAIMEAKEQHAIIERCISDNYIRLYSLFNTPTEAFFNKEKLVKIIQADVVNTLLFVCHGSKINDAEEAIIFAVDEECSEYHPNFLEEWKREYESNNGNSYPLIGSMSFMLTVDYKYGLNGDNSRSIFRAILVLFQLIIDADEDKDRRKNKRRIVDGLIKAILDTEEAKSLQINLLRPLVNRRSQILENMTQLDKYISDMESDLNRKFALDRIKSGICYIAVKGQDGYRFYPSRFVGYINNSRVEHELDYYRDGIETNKAISDILNRRPVQNQDMEQEYLKYCSWLGIQANDNGARGRPRKYWILEE